MAGANTQAHPDLRDCRLLAAWGEITDAERKAIRAALAKPMRLGAHVTAKLPRANIATTLGAVVVSSMVTPLGREMVEAESFNSAEAT